MNELTDTIKKADTATLWLLLSDLSEVIGAYTPDRNNNAFMIWYQVYKQLEAEIDRRMIADFMEG